MVAIIASGHREADAGLRRSISERPPTDAIVDRAVQAAGNMRCRCLLAASFCGTGRYGRGTYQPSSLCKVPTPRHPTSTCFVPPKTDCMIACSLVSLQTIRQSTVGLHSHCYDLAASRQPGGRQSTHSFPAGGYCLIFKPYTSNDDSIAFARSFVEAVNNRTPQNLQQPQRQAPAPQHPTAADAAASSSMWNQSLGG